MLAVVGNSNFLRKVEASLFHDSAFFISDIITLIIVLTFANKLQKLGNKVVCLRRRESRNL